jgi:multiple sugar transport system ATP-binding protein
MNVFNANIVCRDGTLSFELVGSDVCLKYPQVRFSSAVLNALQGRQQVVLGIRPYAVKRQAEGVSATVAVNQWLGDQSHIAADFAGQSIILVEHDRALDKPGDRLSLHIDPSSLHLFDPVSGMAISHGDSLA